MQSKIDWHGFPDGSAWDWKWTGMKKTEMADGGMVDAKGGTKKRKPETLPMTVIFRATNLLLIT